ncbi:MAG: hypothetical protein BAJATHORv1_20536 [Candidatus Thorarchaeota archaeon]|nr:MAG: hypothetical protein BAJATHORv1_20536 [Candidatus Thorarchaeota archaeon]
MIKSDEEKIEVPNPTIALSNQVDIVRTITMMYLESKNPLGRNDIAPLVGLTGDNVSRCFSFWKSIGVIEVESRGKYRPTEKFTKYYQDTPDSFFESLLPVIDSVWFVSAIRNRLTLNPSITRQELYDLLDQTARIHMGSNPDSRSIDTLLKLVLSTSLLDESDDSTYMLSSGLDGSVDSVKEPRDIPPDDVILFRLDIGVFAIDTEIFVEFVIEKGKKVSDPVEVGNK